MLQRSRRRLSAEEIAALWQCPALPVRKAEQAAQISRNKLYALMSEGALPFVMLGRLRLIRTDALRKLVTEGLPPDQEKAVSR
jgi:excisionase family DNA binding protein